MADEKITLWVKVQPNARRNEILGFRDGAWQVRIAAPPVKGKANQELLKYLSQILEISKHQLTIEKGMTARRKAISISGLTRSQVEERLKKHGSELH